MFLSWRLAIKISDSLQRGERRKTVMSAGHPVDKSDRLTG